MYIVYISSSQYSQGQSRIYIHVEVFASERGIGRDMKTVGRGTTRRFRKEENL